ncbi:MAG: hypothetical protein J6M66_12765 [Lachnospiraceae bacterium]|nr:hypothetical protein [Lachnospiraceae bacterium]
MPEPKKIAEFPSYLERQTLMEDLKRLEREGVAPESKEIYQQYISNLEHLNALMDQYSELDEEFGVPPALDARGKEQLLQAMYETAVAGETFLANAQIKNGKVMNRISAVVGRLQGMLSQDHAMLRLYDPEQTSMSFPEIQESARTQVVDFRGKKIGIMTNKLSGRIPMTVVDAEGKKKRGVFTKASYVSVKKDFHEMIDRALAYYDRPEVRNSLAPYKTALIRQGAFPDRTAEQITNDMVVEKLKEQIRNILPRFREYLVQNGKTLYGMDPEKVPEEQLIGFLYNEIMNDKSLTVTLEKIGLDLRQQPEEIADELTDGMKRAIEEKLSDIVNARDLGLCDGDRVDHRNSALSAVAGLIGLNSLCARSVNMKYLDEDGNEVEGTFMEFADGLDLLGKGGEKLFTHVNDDPFGSPCKANRSLADLQILDFLSGNVDRHGGNMTYKVDAQGKIVDVVAFDNDTSFGLVPIDKKNGILRLGGVEQLKVISKPMAQKIAGLSPEMLKFSLRGRGLTEAEIKASCQRLSELKRAIKAGKEARSAEDIRSAGKELCIVEPKDLEQIPFEALAEQKHTLFQNVKQYMDEQMKKAREQYAYDPEAARPEEKQLEEVGTTERNYVAGGISQSMGDMARMLKNEVTGFEVKGLSKFMRSSGKWRSMISAVENAEKVSARIKQEIGMDLEGVPRDDPRVKEKLDRADRAMEQVKAANDAYLQRKMKEKNVTTPEELAGKGKHGYEQNRIDYALKLRKSVMKYEAIKNPQTKEEVAKKAAVKGKLKFANARKNPEPKQLGL